MRFLFGHEGPRTSLGFLTYCHRLADKLTLWPIFATFNKLIEEIIPCGLVPGTTFTSWVVLYKEREREYVGCLKFSVSPSQDDSKFGRKHIRTTWANVHPCLKNRHPHATEVPSAFLWSQGGICYLSKSMLHGITRWCCSVNLSQDFVENIRLGALHRSMPLLSLSPHNPLADCIHSFWCLCSRMFSKMNPYQSTLTVNDVNKNKGGSPNFVHLMLL